MSTKTLAVKILDSKKVAYRIHSYSEEERDAERVALQIGVPAERVFKTLVATRDQGKPVLVMVPANQQLDLKKLAKELGEKKVKLASHNDAEELTGLQVGGISPLVLLNRGFEILIDKSAASHSTICISAGKKGLNLELGVKDLIEITDAQPVDVTR